MIDRAAAVIPNLRDLIEFKDAATPLTYERYTHNPNGASSAWSWNPQNKFYKSILKSYVDTPGEKSLDRLLLVLPDRRHPRRHWRRLRLCQAN